MARYNCYVKEKIRAVPALLDVDKAEAIEFLKKEKYGVVFNTLGKQKTLEELQNVKSLGSKSGTGKDNTASGFGEVFESSDRKLSKTSSDKTE